MNKRKVYQLLSNARPVKILIEHFTWDKWDKPYIYMDGDGDICKGNGVYFDFNSAPYDGYEIYKPKQNEKTDYEKDMEMKMECLSSLIDTMKDPEVKSNENIYIISNGKAYFPWQRYIRKVFKQEEITNRILSLDDIKNVDGKFCIYITSLPAFERVKKHLPKELNGAFISSSVDPYSEEYRYNTRGISHELRKIGVPAYKIHASGHAKPHDIIKLVQEIKPERIIPIHTKYA